MQQEQQEIKKLSVKYLRQSCGIVIVITLIMSFIMKIFDCYNTMIVPTVVGTMFFIIIETADALIWRWIAEKHSDNMSAFFTGVSGFRMLLAVAVMFVYYLLSDKDAMLPLFLVFVAYYSALMIHHSCFFIRLMHKKDVNAKNTTVL